MNEAKKKKKEFYLWSLFAHRTWKLCPLTPTDTGTALTNFCLVPETFLLSCGFDVVSGLVLMLVFPLACSNSLPPCPSPSPLFRGEIQPFSLTYYSEGFKHTLFFQRAPPNLWQCRNILVNNMTPQDCLVVRFFFWFHLRCVWHFSFCGCSMWYENVPNG